MKGNRPTRACLVGIGGYGATHLRAFQQLKERGIAELASVVERNRDGCSEAIAELEKGGVRCFTGLEEALAHGGFEFVVLSVPLHLHRPMTVQALEAGFPVLCEKSAAPTVQDVQAMADAAERTGLPLDIAYWHQSSSKLIATQQAVVRGVVGQVRRVVVRGGWLRYESYYQRSAWAGRSRVGGLWTLDGPVNNPLAHYLLAGMYLASGEAGHVANPVRVRGELYRGRPTIEGEDTACIHAEFEHGVSEYIYVTLLAAEETYRKVSIEVHGDAGVVSWHSSDEGQPARYERRDGTSGVIEHAGIAGSTQRCIENFVRYLAGESDTLISPIGDSLKLVRLSNGAFDSSRKVHPIAEPPVVRHGAGDALYYELPGICEQMRVAGEQEGLFSDIGTDWAVRTEPVDVSQYNRFPQAFEPTERPWDSSGPTGHSAG